MPGMAEIRPGVPGDLPFLPEIEYQAALRLQSGDVDHAELYTIFSAHVTSASEFAEYIEDGRLWVAVEDGRPVGFITVSVIDDHAHIDEVDVLPDYGRRGIGRALIETACQWAVAQGRASITLSTQVNVVWNAPFYEKLGFEVWPSDEWSAAYKALRQHEAELGFPVGQRVLMIRHL